MATKVATKGAGAAPTVEQIQSDIITQVSMEVIWIGKHCVVNKVRHWL